MPPRMTRSMQARHNNHVAMLSAIVEAVRETSDEVPPQVTMHHWIGVRELQDFRNRRIHCIDELIAETLTLSVIPAPSALDVRDCRR